MSSPASQRLETLPPDATLERLSDTDGQRLLALLEEWALLRDQGRDVPVAELCRDCPHLAEALAGEIALLCRFEPPAPVATARPETPAREFAGLRYQPESYHAQGGLGVVFVARDTEVGRQVALKQIQPRRRHLPLARERFQREAEVTGRLEHPGIVPVYSIGHDGSGHPYYAMRLIQGRTLAAAIDELSRPRSLEERKHGLRRLLHRFVAVCQTVAYAHSKGVIHRDLKPSNILLGDYGETLVIDWGLARRLDDAELTQRGEEESRGQGSSPTQTGKGLGTWGFMSPEQARGDWKLVGPASDLFSLGATLYAILTGRAPQPGPLARPRQLSRAVPPALEAVCLKAMAEQPAARYSSALDLAADVQRWLDDEAVLAYREPLSQRLGRWGRRHRTLVAAGVVLLLASVVGLALGLGAVGREQARTAAALQEARDNLERARQAEQEAKNNLKLARRAVDECFNVAKEHPLFQKPRMEPARKLLLEKTLPFYRNFRAQRPDDPALQRDEAEQWLRVAYIEQALGRYPAARQASEQARGQLAQLVQAHPGAPEYRSALARTHNGLGALLYDLGQRREAARQFQRARRLQRKLVADHPDVPEYQNILAGTHSSLGLLLHTLGKRPDALKEYEQARDLQAKLVRAHARVPEYRNALAGTHITLGNLLSDLGRHREALEEYQHARDLQSKLIASHPEAPGYRHALALTQANRGLLLARGGKRAAALEAYRQAHDLLAGLVKAHPELPEYQNDLALVHNAQGALLLGLGRHPEAQVQLQRARDLQRKLAREQPEVPWNRYFLARTHKDLGELLAAQGKHQEALAEYHQARLLQTRLVKDHPELAWYRNALATTHNNLGNLLCALGNREEARQELQHALDLRKKLVEAHPDVPDYRHRLAGTHTDLGKLLADRGQREEALAEYRQAHHLHGKLVEACPDWPEYVEGLAAVCINRGELLARLGRPHDSLVDLDQGIHLLDELRRLDPRHPRAPKLLLSGLSTRAVVLTRLGRPRDADADWARALALAPQPRLGRLHLLRAACRMYAFVTALVPAPERRWPGRERRQASLPPGPVLSFRGVSHCAWETRGPAARCRSSSSSSAASFRLPANSTAFTANSAGSTNTPEK